MTIYYFGKKLSNLYIFYSSTENSHSMDAELQHEEADGGDMRKEEQKIGCPRQTGWRCKNQIKRSWNTNLIDLFLFGSRNGIWQELTFRTENKWTRLKGIPWVHGEDKLFIVRNSKDEKKNLQWLSVLKNKYN